MAKKKLPHSDKFVRTGGAMGDPTMDELDKFNQEGASVDSSHVKNVGNDPNADIFLSKNRRPGSEA